MNNIKQKNFLELSKYKNELFNNPKLTFLFLELTDACNLNCYHCGSSCSNKNKDYLKFSAIKKTLKSVSEKLNPKSILIILTGGEPCLHPDLLRIIAYAKDLGFNVGMTTNGTLIDDDLARSLQFAGLDSITISIDGLEKTHDIFRKMPGAFNMAFRGIQALKNCGFMPEVATVVHKDDYHELEELYSLLLKEDITDWRLINVEPIGRAKENADILLTDDQLRLLFEYIRTKRFDENNPMGVSYSCSHFLSYNFENEVRDFYFHCGAGTFIASIMANGDIGACLDIERKSELIQGNIYKDDFMDIWEHHFKQFRLNRALLSKTCRGCEHTDTCMGDAAHTWDFDKNEPYYCISKILEV